MKNCWEIKQCGRGPGGENTEELGLCPAAMPCHQSGVNRGEYGGRFCWIIAGTFCKDEVQGTFSKKLLTCIHCDFFKMVQEEESINFIFLPTAEVQTLTLRPD